MQLFVYDSNIPPYNLLFVSLKAFHYQLITRLYFQILQKSLRVYLKFACKLDSLPTLPLLILSFMTLHVTILSLSF